MEFWQLLEENKMSQEPISNPGFTRVPYKFDQDVPDACYLFGLLAILDPFRQDTKKN